MYVYIYLYTYILCINIITHKYLYTYIYIYLCAYLCAYVYISTYTYTSTIHNTWDLKSSKDPSLLKKYSGGRTDKCHCSQDSLRRHDDYSQTYRIHLKILGTSIQCW